MNYAFYKNKNKYIITISLLIFVSIVLLRFGYLWIIDSSSYVYWLLPNKNIVFLVGLLSILCASILIMIIYFSLTNKDFYLRIDEKGLFVGSLIYKNKLINWSNIKKIEVLEKNKNKYIKILVYDTNIYKERGLRYLIYYSSLKFNGTPFLIHTGVLNGDFNEIYNAIKDGHKFYINNFNKTNKNK